jgi:hypothetical protein
MLKTNLFNIKEFNYVLSHTHTHIYIYIYIYVSVCEHIIVLLSYFPSNSKFIIDMLQYKFFDVHSLI